MLFHSTQLQPFQCQKATLNPIFTFPVLFSIMSCMLLCFLQMRAELPEEGVPCWRVSVPGVYPVTQHSCIGFLLCTSPAVSVRDCSGEPVWEEMGRQPGRPSSQPGATVTAPHPQQPGRLGSHRLRAGEPLSQPGATAAAPLHSGGSAPGPCTRTAVSCARMLVWLKNFQVAQLYFTQLRQDPWVCTECQS